MEQKTPTESGHAFVFLPRFWWHDRAYQRHALISEASYLSSRCAQHSTRPFEVLRMQTNKQYVSECTVFSPFVAHEAIAQTCLESIARARLVCKCLWRFWHMHKKIVHLMVCFWKRIVVEDDGNLTIVVMGMQPCQPTYLSIVGSLCESCVYLCFTWSVRHQISVSRPFVLHLPLQMHDQKAWFSLCASVLKSQ